MSNSFLNPPDDRIQMLGTEVYFELESKILDRRTSLIELEAIRLLLDNLGLKPAPQVPRDPEQEPEQRIRDPNTSLEELQAIQAQLTGQ